MQCTYRVLRSCLRNIDHLVIFSAGNNDQLVIFSAGNIDHLVIFSAGNIDHLVIFSCGNIGRSGNSEKCKSKLGFEPTY
jgi:hypothetical protein